MKLTIREDSSNYAVSVVKLPPKQKVEGLDKLVRVTIFGNDVLTQKDSDENILYLFFPAGCQISNAYLSKNNEFKESTLNMDKSQRGFFEENGRVKAIKFKGVISTGYIAPLNTMNYVVSADYMKKFKEGDEFTTIDGIDLVKKYVPKNTRTQSEKSNNESRYNKKLKRFDRLVNNQFRFHTDTPQLAKCLHLIKPDDIIVITDKWHGTSAVFSNLLIRTERTWYEKLAAWITKPILGKYLNFNKYDSLYSSRSVIKNQYINKEAGPGYYGEDIWGVVNKELEGKIEEGISLYGEIVGYTPSGKAIQGGYDYGCIPNMEALTAKTREFAKSTYGHVSHRFLVYKITYTKPNGDTILFSWDQTKEYCKKYNIEHVLQLYYGRAYDFTLNTSLCWNGSDDAGRAALMESLSHNFLEKDCTHCSNKVPAEGVCVRIDGKSTYSTFKLKSKRFMTHESDELDKGVVSIEDSGVEETTTSSN